MLRRTIFVLLILILNLSIGFSDAVDNTIDVAIFDNEPMNFMEGDQARGFFVDLLEAVAKEEGWQLNYQFYSFADGLTAVETGEVDLMLGVAWSEPRSDLYSYNHEIGFVNWGQVYAKPNAQLYTFGDLDGKTIGVMSGDIHYIGPNGIKNTIEQFGYRSGYIEFDDKMSLLEAVEDGLLDAGIVNRTFGLSNEANFDIKRTSLQLNPINMKFITMRGRNLEILDTIDRYLKPWKEDNDSIYYSRLAYWFDLKTEEVIPSWVRILLTLVIVLLVLSMVVITTTRRIIKKQTNELLELNKTLEVKVEERTMELDAINQQLKASLEITEDKSRQLKVQMIELENAQDQIIRSEKLASLGKMVASLAHEMNTPLGVCITLNSNLHHQTKILKADLVNGELSRSDLVNFVKDLDESSAMLSTNLDTVVDLLKQFRLLAHGDSEDHKRVVNIQGFFENQLKALKTEFDKGDHSYHVNCDESLFASIDITGMSQVIINLAMNAIYHGFENRKNGRIIIDVNKDQDHLVISFADNGKGIDEEVKNHMFEPFFTTKRNLGRTGLGLSIIHNVIEESMKGEIMIDDNNQEGLKYIIVIPYIEK